MTIEPDLHKDKNRVYAAIILKYKDQIEKQLEANYNLLIELEKILSFTIDPLERAGYFYKVELKKNDCLRLEKELKSIEEKIDRLEADLSIRMDFLNTVVDSELEYYILSFEEQETPDSEVEYRRIFQGIDVLVDEVDKFLIFIKSKKVKQQYSQQARNLRNRLEQAANSVEFLGKEIDFDTDKVKQLLQSFEELEKMFKENSLTPQPTVKIEITINGTRLV